MLLNISCCLFFLGREWAATTTEGLLIYALDNNLVFDPFDLEMDIVPENVVKMLDKKEYSTALMLAFRLNENALIQRVLEQIPVSDGKFVVKLSIGGIQTVLIPVGVDHLL